MKITPFCLFFFRCFKKFFFGLKSGFLNILNPPEISFLKRFSSTKKTKKKNAWTKKHGNKKKRDVNYWKIFAVFKKRFLWEKNIIFRKSSSKKNEANFFRCFLFLVLSFSFSSMVGIFFESGEEFLLLLFYSNFFAIAAAFVCCFSSFFFKNLLFLKVDSFLPSFSHLKVVAFSISEKKHFSSSLYFLPPLFFFCLLFFCSSSFFFFKFTSFVRHIFEIFSKQCHFWVIYIKDFTSWKWHLYMWDIHCDDIK